MNFDKILKKTLTNIVKKRNQLKVVTDFQNFIDKNGWPIAINKDIIYRSIDCLINAEIPSGYESLIDLLLYDQKRTLPKLTDYQKKMLEKVRNITYKANVMKCNHKIKIGVFYHGGGFTPSFIACPELICEKCGLNVTIHRRKSKELEKSIGIKISKPTLGKLYEWADICLKEGKVKSANNITKDPIRALELSEKWAHKIPFKVIDIKRFEKASGV